MLLAANCLWFTWKMASPLPVSDEWFFIKTFINKIYNHKLGLADFYRIRFSTDHAQPLQKSLLYIHTKFFDFDFVFDSMVSITMGLLTTGWTVHMLIKQQAIAQDDGVGSSSLVNKINFLLLAAISFSLLSFNVTDAYTWPLVGEFFVTFTVVVWFFYVLSSSVSANKISLGLSFVTFSLVLLLDTLGLIAVCCGAIYAVLHTAFLGRAVVLKQLMLKVVPAVIVARLIVNSLKPKFSAAGSMSQELQAAQDYFFQYGHDFFYWFLIPATSSIIHKDWLTLVLNDRGGVNLFIIIFGILVIASHVWFWRQWRLNFNDKVASFAALLMMYAYIGLISIILFRLPRPPGLLLGPEMLHVFTRYVVFSYQVSVFAFLILFWRVVNNRTGFDITNKIKLHAIYALLLSYFALQVFFISCRWQDLEARNNFIGAQANAIYRLALISTSGLNNNYMPGFYPYNLVVFQFSPAHRKLIFDLLMNNKLSIFSADFRVRHNIVLKQPVSLPKL